jgi:hypothetical protein
MEIAILGTGHHYCKEMKINTQAKVTYMRTGISYKNF